MGAGCSCGKIQLIRPGEICSIDSQGGLGLKHYDYLMGLHLSRFFLLAYYKVGPCPVKGMNQNPGEGISFI
jgi:hypothetical protein